MPPQGQEAWTPQLSQICSYLKEKTIKQNKFPEPEKCLQLLWGGEAGTITRAAIIDSVVSGAE